jgi:hypothetical protein
VSRGAGVERDAHGRRTRERDRFGGDVATLAWTTGGRLAGAAVRLPDGGWLSIAPRAAHDARWGASDALLAGEVALTHFAAVDWAAVDAIPVLAEPAQLPAGAGTAVLNLLAALAADQGRGPLAYRGPYPTEQLFLALLESFRWQAEGDVDPLAAFMAGGLAWAPAPHARAFAPAGVYVQSRARIEKVVWRGRAYYRRDWQGVERHGAHRVRDAEGRVVCSLVALDTALEDHVVLAADGSVLETREPTAGTEAPRPVPPALASGLVAVIVAGSAPPLAEALHAVAGELTFEWAPLAGELAAVGAGAARVSPRLLRALAARLAAAPSRAEHVRLGFAALAELAQALGDDLRRRAQARLAGAPAAAQAAALDARRGTDAAAAARRIGEAVERLLGEAAQLLA